MDTLDNWWKSKNRSLSEGCNRRFILLRKMVEQGKVIPQINEIGWFDISRNEKRKFAHDMIWVSAVISFDISTHYIHCCGFATMCILPLP